MLIYVAKYKSEAELEYALNLKELELTMNYTFSPSKLVLELFCGSRKAVLYGNTQEADVLLKKYPSIFNRIVDRRLTNIGEFVNGLKVISISDITDADIVINAVTTAYFGDVEKLIKTRTSRTIHVFDFLQLLENNHQFNQPDFSPVISEWCTFPTVLRENACLFEEIFNSLYDKKSKEVFENYMNSRITGDLRYLALTNTFSDPATMYFCDFLGDLSKFTFFDIGAFDGANSIAFCEIYPNSRAICFEPEESQFIRINERVKKNENIQSFHLFIGSRDGYIYFLSNNSSSCAVNMDIEKDDKNIFRIQQVTLDSFVKNNNFLNIPLFVKMDVEGAELDVLKGGMVTLAQENSIIAISVYHKSNDLVTLWPYIKEIGKGKKYYFRHFTCGANETVIFIVP